MRFIKGMLVCLLVIVAPVIAGAEEADVQERIKALQQQLETLKQMKIAQQKAMAARQEECYRVFPSHSFCSCIALQLPPDVTFEQYVKEISRKGPRMPDLIAVRDACAERL